MRKSPTSTMPGMIPICRTASNLRTYSVRDITWAYPLRPKRPRPLRPIEAECAARSLPRTQSAPKGEFTQLVLGIVQFSTALGQTLTLSIIVAVLSCCFSTEMAALMYKIYRDEAKSPQ
ncbi:hypothetical protein BDW66DRAFT_98854 [Aspergillus desertorum]